MKSSSHDQGRAAAVGFRKRSLGCQRIGYVGFGSSSELAARLLLDMFPNLATADLQTVSTVAALTFVRLADDLREWDGKVAAFTGRDLGGDERSTSGRINGAGLTR